MKCLKAWIPNSLYRCVMKAEKMKSEVWFEATIEWRPGQNELIQTVYKNKLVEQEMLVSRKMQNFLPFTARLIPHFLFNALESIRMHSILKNENGNSGYG